MAHERSASGDRESENEQETRQKPPQTVSWPRVRGLQHCSPAWRTHCGAGSV